VPDADVVREVRRNPRALVIDLTASLPEPKANALVTCARDGTPLPAMPSKAALSPHGHAQGAFVPLANRGKPRLQMRPPAPRSGP
jgi:hypothetical protein